MEFKISFNILTVPSSKILKKLYKLNTIITLELKTTIRNWELESLGFNMVMLTLSFSILWPPIKKRRNKITHFKNEAGEWINDPIEILNHIYDYFLKAFSTSHQHTNWLDITTSPNTFGRVNLDSLDNPLMPYEITKDIFSFKPFKAPGPYGIHLFFYQKY